MKDDTIPSFGLGAFHYEKEDWYPERYYKCWDFISPIGREWEKKKSVSS